MEKSDRAIPTVNDVQIIEASGPWNTKSGGKLSVVFAMPLATVQDRFLHYEAAELGRVPCDIRGLRAYTVRDLPNGRIGGTEWHRIREEMVFALDGSVRWMCEDLLGGQRDFTLDIDVGVWMPPFILHTYEVKEERSGLFVIANTLFVPDDPRTHDTYSMETFRELQTEYIAKPK